MFKKLAITAAAAFVSCTIAQAADMPKPVYRAPPPVVVAAYNWSGFYIGGNVGYGTGDVSANGWGEGLSKSFNGWFAGGQLGWNWQAVGSPWVWGFEADWQGADFESDFTLANGFVNGSGFSRLNWFATARGRVGYAWDRVMFYTTGGFAWAENEIGISGLVETKSFTHTGWTIGAGLEWALVNNWTVKLEYLFLDFGSKEYFPNTINGLNINDLGFNADADIHTIKLGLNYRFGYGKDPYVAARY